MACSAFRRRRARPKPRTADRHRRSHARDVALDRLRGRAAAIRERAAAATISNRCSVTSTSNERPGARIHPIRRILDADDERASICNPDAAWMGDLRAAGSRRHSRVRGARLDAGPRRSTRPRARSTSPARIRPRASLRRLPRSRSRRCSTRWEIAVRSARPNRPTARLRCASHSFFKNIAEASTEKIAGRMYADSDRETPAEMPGFLLPSP